MFTRAIKGALSGALFAVVCLPAAAQDVQFSVVDAGVSTHSTHGIGIELRIAPSRIIPANAPVPETALAQLCAHFAPNVVPAIMDQTDVDDPDFIGVRLLLGEPGSGDFVFRAFEFDAGGCGSVL